MGTGDGQGEDRQGRLDTVYTERVSEDTDTARPREKLTPMSWARRIDRYAYDQEVQLFDGGRRVESAIIALSAEDVYIRTDHAFALDTLLAFQLPMPEGVPLLMVGTVVSRGLGPTGHPGVALRMEPLKGKAIGRFQALLDTLDPAEFETLTYSEPEVDFAIED